MTLKTPLFPPQEAPGPGSRKSNLGSRAAVQKEPSCPLRCRPPREFLSSR